MSKKVGIINKEIVIKNDMTNEYELNLPSNMDNSEIIFYLNQEVLSLNKSIKQLEQKKTAVLEMLEERVKQEKYEAENQKKENEINQKQKYLSQIYGKNKDNKVIQTNNIKRDQQQNNSIFEASQNPYQSINNSDFYFKNSQQSDQKVSPNKNSNVFGRITDIDYDKRLNENMSSMNFNQELDNQTVLNHVWNSQKLDTNNNSISNNFDNNSNINNKYNYNNPSQLAESKYISYDRNNNNNQIRSQNKMQIEYDPMGVSNASNNNSFSKQNQKQTLSQNGMVSEFDERMEKMEQESMDYKEALQKYFDIPQPVMKNLSLIDELTEEKLNQTGQYFGLKTGKSNQKSLKQGLKDINWFLTRNKLPQGYLQNYKSGIEQEISIPQESLVTVFDYKH